MNGTSQEPSEPDEDGGQAGKVASRPLPWRPLLLIILARSGGLCPDPADAGADRR